MTVLTVKLPWPPRILNPNSRAHWREKAPIIRQYRHDCGWFAKEAGWRKLDAKRANVRVEFYPPNSRKRDLDNCIAACKPMFDGLSDIVGIDDAKWHIEFKMNTPTRGGAVLVTLEGVG